MAANPRVHTLSRWTQWRYSLRAWLPTSLLLLFFLGLFVFLYCIAPSLDMADVRGAPTQHARSMVSAVSYIRWVKVP